MRTSFTNPANTLWKDAFVLLISFAFFFHVFNTLQVSESVKVFHLFAVGAIVPGCFIMGGKSNSTGKVFLLFILWTFFSSLLSPISVSIMAGIKFVIVALSTFFITKIQINTLIRFINYLIPFLLVALIIHYVNSSAVYRYQGFYDDPNYLCTTLLVFLFFILIGWNGTKNTVIRIGLVVEILIITYLVTVSISRTGLLCLFLMLLGFFWDILIQNKLKSILGVLIVLGVVLLYKPDLVEKAVSSYVNRETENVDTISGAADLRWEISKRGLTYVFHHPRYFLFGIGIGSYSSAKELPGWYASTDHMDHNTFTSCLSEQGIIGLLLYLGFLFSLFKRILRNQILHDLKLKRICLVSFFAFLVFSISIYQLNYLPFWFVLMALVNMSAFKGHNNTSVE